MPSLSLPASRAQRLALALALAVVLYAVVAAGRAAWLCDDAFICFRYAQNWIEGRGLVFNAGERVEGYTNPLWTVGIALGMKLGVSPERWTTAWGIAAYAGTVATLLAVHWQARRVAGLTGLGLPLAALAAVLHTDLVNYATSGLETSLFIFLTLAGTALVAFPGSARRAFAAGVVLGLAAVTRQDGVLFAAVAGLSVATGGRPAIRQVGALAAGFLLVFGPVSAARVAYYGDFFPNTYYAKSGGSVWYAQGLRYLSLYHDRYWIVTAGGAVWGVVALWLARRPADAWRDAVLRPGLVFAAAGVAYGFYVVRVGGDFMFARLLLPATAPLLVVADLALVFVGARGAGPLAEPAGPERARAALASLPAMAGAAVYLAVLALTPSPIKILPSGYPDRIDGITDERAFYAPAVVAEQERRAATLGPLLAGLPVRLAFYGAEARLVYRTRVPVAVEGHAGLTDAFVAHQALPARGRVGHEKLAPASYLLGVRRVHLTFSRVPTDQLGLDELIPRVRGDFGGVTGRILTWDPELVAALRGRGVIIPDFLATLDEYVAKVLPTAPLNEVEQNYRSTARFYFATVADPAREKPFLDRLGLPARPGAAPAP